MRNLLAATLIAFSSIALAQKSVPPPAKPADNGPSLEVTMKFIQEKLNDQGTFNYVEFIHDDADGSDWTRRWSETQASFKADPGTCTVGYHYNVVTDKKDDSPRQYDLGFSLREVKALSVMTSHQAKTTQMNDRGYAWTIRTVPTFFVLRVTTVDSSPAKLRVPPSDLNFHDEDTANRVARALNHAVELCGGGEKDEPF
jgi:hypothetical protein